MRKLIIPKLELKELYLNQDLTTYQIADKFDCCQATIWKRLHEYGIKTRFPWNAVDISKQELQYLYLRRKLSTWEIEKRYGYGRGTIHRKLRKFGIPTRNIASSHFLFPRRDFSGDLSEKAYLIGFAMGDLNVTKRGPRSETIIVKCGTTQKAQVNLFKKLFGRYGKIWEGRPNGSNATNIQVSLNLSFSFLLKKKKLVDDWIIRSKKRFFAFLAGFSDAEGSFFLSRNRGAFSLGNYNLELLKQIKTTLREFGIRTPKICIDHRKGLVSPQGYIWRGNYYTLHCSEMNNLVKLINNLRPFIGHLNKIKSMEKVYSKTITKIHCE
jgi:hypothetical protein